MTETRFYIGKMDCATEEQIINNRLGRMKEVDQLEFDLMNRVLTVKHRLDDERALMDALNSIGMGPELLKPGQTLPEEHAEHEGCGYDHGHGQAPAKPKRAERGPAVGDSLGADRRAADLPFARGSVEERDIARQLADLDGRERR